MITLVCMTGCGDDEPTPTPIPDAGTQTDAGTEPVPDSGTEPTPDAGTGALDSDIAVVRFNQDGTHDTTFGAGGVTHVDFGPGRDGTRDSLWDLKVDATNRIVLFGNKRGEGARADTDRVVARLTSAGALDTTFGSSEPRNGFSVLNLSNLNDGMRNGLIQQDGKIMASGYTSMPTGVGAQAANRIVLQRLNDDGSSDATFGWQGVVTSAPFLAQSETLPEWGMAEAYAVGQQSNGSYVTSGYGRVASSGTVDLVSFRYTPTGELDPTWGTGGSVVLDLAGDNDYGRHMVILSDDRMCSVGSSALGAQNTDGLILMLTADGQRDTTFAPEGYKTYDFDRPNNAFFGVAASPDGNWIAAAGFRAGGNQNDDAILAIIPTGGAGAEVFKATPISATENDRFWAVTFDASNRIYATGFVTEGGDSRMVVARFTIDGNLDPTFGVGGIATLNVVTGATEEAGRGIALQSDGKIVIAGPVEKL
ncbi:Delta-60 repeat domain protein [Myxococcus hansupus]|uniref:Delta-60 repeat domain protein n=1 Tax=Pseudomyxococcus hansupus TaxID=1297742 RepID=A0A0H4WWY4_9BACT|nr:delta-60 repeat domain-containing protein [Myxococcus hansupus]AKQ65865.1 Delta-60 repeat domain protein [Myxococcus hansupus]